MNRNLRRIVPAAITVAATMSLSTLSLATLTAGSASALTATFASSLTGVSCPAAADCMAVGWSEAENQSSVNYTLGESWNGKSWTIIPTPSPSHPGGGAQLNAISCASSTECMAVGAIELFEPPQALDVPEPLAEAWNGTKWTLVPTPKLSQKAGSLNGVSCASATGCVAVGSQGPSSDPTKLTLAESWDGSAWKVTATPAPSKKGGTSLNGVSCLSATNCMAVGYDAYNNGFGTSQSLAERWNGSSWTRLTTPTPGGSGSFTGVACPSVTDCIAVGSHANKVTLDVPFAAGWNGSTWTTQSTPFPKGQGGAGFGGISCTAAAACMATGSSVDQMGETTATLAESWNGQGWTELGSPSPRYNNQLNSVACAIPADCQSVGSSQDESGNQVTLGEAWNGTKWSLVNTPNP